MKNNIINDINIIPYKVICIGGSNIDRKQYVYNSININTTNIAKSTLSYGGVARNVSENLIRLGFDVNLLTCYGTDDDGILLKNNFKLNNINVELSFEIPNVQTSSYNAIIDKDGELFVATVSNLDIYNSITVEKIQNNWSKISDAEYVFLDTFFNENCIKYVLDKCKEENKCLIVNPVSPIEAMKLPNDLSGIYLLIANEKEACSLSGITSINEGFHKAATERIQEKGVKNVVLTCGAKGIYYFDNSCNFRYLPSYNTKAIDTVGAGDAFIAGMIFSHKKMHDFYKMCTYGLAAASLAVQELNTAPKSLNPENLEIIISSTTEIV